MSDSWQLEHLASESWMTPEMCTCRTRPDGTRYFTCKRVACDGEGQVCGGYCRPCFDRKVMNRPMRPTVVVLCGSTKFKEQFEQENRRLGLEGKIVLSVSMFGHSGDLTPAEVTDGHPTKTMLDELHKRKIDMADRVLVINPGGYIGSSTRSEIEYAEWFEKPIDYLEPVL